AEHHGLRLVIAAAHHPGAIEERHAVISQLFHEMRVPAPLGARTTANPGKKTTQTTASQIAIITA
ncbi:MAG: hypothetical protein WA754_25650, partial [Pseudolabrys sp.]